MTQRFFIGSKYLTVPREAVWTEAVAAGTDRFVEEIQHQLGTKGKFRKVYAQNSGTGFSLQEPVATYNGNFEGKNGSLRPENSLLWKIFVDI